MSNRVGYSIQVITDITEHLDSEIVEYYNENVNKNKYFSSSLIDIVKSNIKDELKSETSSSELKKALSNKKRILAQKKKRHYENCKKMVESKSWMNDDIERYCFKDIAMNYKMFSEEQWASLYKGMTYEEVEQERLDIIQKWAYDPSEKMIKYPGLEKKTSKAQFVNFNLDLSISILKAIEDLYDFDIERLTFSVINDLNDKSIFGVTREKILLKETDNTGSQIIFSSEDGSRRTIITFDADSFDDGESSVRAFDEKDQAILSHLIKATQKYEGTEFPIMEEQAAIIHAIAKDPKKKISSYDYNDMIKRLKKLSHANIDFYIDDQWAGNIHFINEVEVLETAGKKYVAYRPGDYLVSQIEKDQITQMPATQRDILKDDVAKLLFYTFMTQRVKAFKKIYNTGAENNAYQVVYQYGHFLRFVNFGNGNKKNNHEAIMNALEEYKQKEIFILDYKYVASSKTYQIVFMPLSDIEIEDLKYYFGDNSKLVINDTDNIIGQLSLFSFMEDEE